ncbi:hypothetical protein [Nocardioides sp. zg-DK7169]|uniref:hypothetical protein n=1 Tax=Nocardioides sp. zg-DK7169 TaxID=2736600 RepID=UPI001557E876|nr:hypothetical protein [Nocardioides sp. zg-DK7169]
MSPIVVYVLTALAAVVVVLTRLRLGRSRSAGKLQVGRRLLDVHTGAGVLALVVWTVFLVADDDTAFGGSVAGIIAIGLWWVVALAGLSILLRWVPARGRHAAAGAGDGWSQGPWLSLLAHLGMVVGVGVFTWAYLTKIV